MLTLAGRKNMVPIWIPTSTFDMALLSMISTVAHVDALVEDA